MRGLTPRIFSPSCAGVNAMHSYFLSKHVYWCLTNQHLVFLDLKRDKYLCLDQGDTLAISSALKGWPVSELLDRSEDSRLNERSDKLAGELLQIGVLTTDEYAGKVLSAAEVKMADQSLLDDSTDYTARMSPRHSLYFFSATTLAAAKLRRQSILHLVEQNQRRRIRAFAQWSNFDFSRARALTATFMAYRPLFPIKYRCLFDSLALADYLARYRIFPTWVFGVRMDPFAAHCWIQHDTVVLNDSMDHIRNFTPIMAA